MNKSLFLIQFIFMLNATAQTFDVPRHLPSGRSDFLFHALGDACFTIAAPTPGLPCNPAFITEELDENKYSGRFFAGNNFDYAEEAEDIIENRATQRNVQKFFSQTRSAEFEADLDLSYKRRNWGLSVSPSRLNYYSLIRNRVHPVISLYVSQEQSVRIQYGQRISDEFAGGIQLRGLQRKFVLSEFYLAEAAVEGGSDRVLPILEQRTVFLEPGIVWFPSEVDWRPKVSLAVRQTGYVDTAYTGLPTDPEGQMGLSIQPPVQSGILEIGTQFIYHSDYDNWRDLFRLGGSYQYGRALYAGSFTDDQAALSLMLHLKAFRGGVVVDYRRFENLLGEDDQVRTIYFELGAEI